MIPKDSAARGAWPQQKMKLNFAIAFKNGGLTASRSRNSSLVSLRAFETENYAVKRDSLLT